MEIWKYIVTIIDTENNYLTSERINQLRTLLRQFENELCKAFKPSKIKSKYLHILIFHLPKMLEKEGSPTIFMNEGFENSHMIHRLLMNRGMNLKDKNETKQMILWQYRLLTPAKKNGFSFLQSKHTTPKKEIRRRNRWMNDLNHYFEKQRQSNSSNKNNQRNSEN
jgi:hypothetical protein